ncbi:hypothetical protein EB796_024225 [Bugula neritina]|uniref:G-protein coupled receptors family 1 profile domain-containing protein n=1 Tax=Bugula neritina TaxID=10212 RepID=A0A7J7IV86_BUGNE|nr:hypothetical protein EB796_024225 [Bugula neritina]
MEWGEDRTNKSYIWDWDHIKGWNYTPFFSFFNDFGDDLTFYQYIEFGAVAILSLLSFIVTVLLMVFFLTKKHLRRDLHMYTISIMASSLVLLPFALLIGITRLSPQGWLFGSLACKSTLFVLVMTAFVKIWLMTLISVDRYLRIVHSNHRCMGPKVSVILILVAWVLPVATIAGIVYPNSRSLDVDIYGGISFCTVGFQYHPTIRYSLMYFSTIFALEFILPATIMIVCYSLIMRKINKSTKAILSHSKMNSLKVEKNLRTNIRRRRTTNILIAIMSLFLVMWLPLFALIAIITLDQTMETFKLSSRWIVGQLCILLLNTLIEPFLYSFTAAKTRQELKRTLQSSCVKRKKNIPMTSIDETLTQNCSSTS